MGIIKWFAFITGYTCLYISLRCSIILTRRFLT